MSAKDLLQAAIDAALTQFGTLEGVAPEVLRVVPATNPQFGDYQFNGALPLAKSLKHKPRDIATQIIEKLDVSHLAEAPEIAGPGFINLRLKREWIEGAVTNARLDERLGVEPAAQSETVVVDFSSPNVAKPMHVGHIRSTIIGDALARLLEFAGHTVITDNHIGDWGTAFGKIIVGWKSDLDQDNLAADPIGEMERLYKLINDRGKENPAIEDEARLETAKLQAGDEENLVIWEEVRELSQQQFDEIYSRLDVGFDHTLGESFYNPRLPSLVDDLLAAGVARESEGAVAVFSEGKVEPKNDPFLISKDGEWRDSPAIVRKEDGAATYTTTDLATLEYRLNEWQPASILYVTDSRQASHFDKVFNAFRRWKGEAATGEYVHVGFGMILGDDKKPFKTRSGDNVKLKELLDEAEARATESARAKNPESLDSESREIGRVLGIGAVKYADLSQNRATDYVFSWDKMLSDTGNSAVYLTYAYVRTRSIARRALAQEVDFSPQSRIILEERAELELAKHLLRFGEAIDAALEEYRPHILCEYLYDLAGKFAAFFRDCPVLKEPAPPREVQESRLALVAFTGDVLKKGLNLLGIETIEQM
jgi:arginyl-tRNA synthetase